MESRSTLQSLVDKLDGLGDKECILEMQPQGLTRWTCTEVAGTARRLAQGLIEAGVRPGDVVPILAHNRPEWIIAALAILSSGGVVSPLDTQITPPNLARVLRDSAAGFIFTTTDYLNRLGQLRLENDLRPILFDVAPDDERGWRARLADASPSLPRVEPADPAALFYTSGTTGVPKGVPLTHRNLTFQLQSVHQANLLRDDDRILLPLPMYHVYPFTVGTLTPLAFGLPLVLPQALTGPQILRALAAGRVTIIVGVPRIYRAVYEGLLGQIAARGKLAAAAFEKTLQGSIWLRRRWNWRIGQTLFRPVRARLGPNLRLLTSGGSALDPDLAWKLTGLGWEIGIGYGLTETSPMLTMNIPNNKTPRLGSVGKPLPGIELRLAPVAQLEENDRQNNSAGPVEGEIQARGVSVFAGYRNLPDQTAQAFTADGWFCTGDLGYFDEAGYLYISGRVSTLIVLEGGKKIQPEPLEEIYEQHQFIREIGILYEQNQLAALIVPEIEAVNRLRNGDVQQAIREAVAERAQAVPSYQRITDYAITQQPLPRTNLGKIKRHELVKNYVEARQGISRDDTSAGPIALADMSEQDQAMLAEPAARQVWDWLAGRYPDKNLTPDSSPQFDLGVDSLEWLTITLHIGEQTGVELDEAAIGRIGTVRDLLQEVAAAAESETPPSAALDNAEALLSAEQKQWLNPPPLALQILFTLGFPIFQGLMRLMFKVRAYGLENLPKEGNFVLTPNHRSMLDAPSVAAVLTLAQMRQTHWAGATDIMLSNAFMRLISRMSQVLPLERFGAAGMKNLALALAALQRSKNLVWFPEGHLVPSDEMLPFLEGIGLVLEREPAPVVPVYIQGTREAMPIEAALPRPGRITITFGQPCHPHELAQEGEGDTFATRLVRALQARVVALREQAALRATEEEGPSAG
jgi:long-chain acyl-CoA synthetase